MPLFFLGTREWRNRQTRTVQVRVPVMEWGFNSPLAHEEAADPFGICGFCFPWLLLVVPRVFRAPRGLSRGPGCFVGPGRCVCRWAAARPRDRHTRAALGVVDLEARPGPAATHRHRGQALLPLRRPPHQWGRAAPWAAARPLAVRAASFARRVALKPGQAPPPPINFARNSPAACSNIEFASLELQRFQALLKLRPIELRARFGWRWCRRCPWVLQPGPAAACGRP